MNIGEDYVYFKHNLNTKTSKKYRVVELDKGIYCLNDILGGRKT